MGKSSILRTYSIDMDTFNWKSILVMKSELI